MKTKIKNCVFWVLGVSLLFLTSCSKEIYEENLILKNKEKPNLNLDFISTKTNPKSLEPLLRNYSKKLKRTNNSNQNSEELLTIEGYFGTILLDQVLELNAGTYKTFTFEVDEAVKEPNIYFNVVIDKSENIWLYKMEKLTQPKDGYPANSAVVSRVRLDSNLNALNPCPDIYFPPFGYYTSENPPVSSGGGGVNLNGFFNNPPPNSTGNNSGFFNNPINSNPGNASGGGSGSGGSGGGIEVIVAVIVDASVGAWNWLVGLFTGKPKPGENTPCDCPHRRGVVVVEETSIPCGDGATGFIGVIPQDAYVDKINKFKDYFSVLHNNDNVFLYENPAIVDYINDLIVQNPNNNSLLSALPEIISKVRINEIDWEFAKVILDTSIELDINGAEVWNKRDEYRSRMSDAEKIIFDNMLPNRRFWYLATGEKASVKAEEFYPNSLHNGKGDAFRHCYWNALSSKFIGITLTNQLTTAHEDKPFTYPFEQKEKDMDLFNNNIGQNIANYVSILNDIEQEVLTQLNFGFLRYLSNLNSRSLPTYLSFLTPTNQ